MRVVAFDISLNCTGVADANGTRTIEPKSKGCERLREVRDEVLKVSHVTDNGSGPLCVTCTCSPIYGCHPDIIAIEGYAFGRPNQAHAIGEMGGVIRLALYEARLPFILVPPATLKFYACGKGNASKDDVLLAAVRRLGYEGSSKDEADALWLYTLVMDAAGCGFVDMPAKNREALPVVQKLLTLTIEEAA